MGEVLEGTAIVILGVVIIVFRKALAHKHVKQQNQLFGFNFGEREERISRWISLLGGTGFVVFGVLIILGAG